MPGWTFTTQEAVIYQGTTIFLFTDGLTEAENAEHDQFQMDRINEVAERVLAEHKQDPKTFIAMMTDAVHEFVGDAEQSDDLTMFAIQFLKGTPPPES
jgi:sigma-B regulation protein RsbU (phosphoserine phosphatase)